MISMTDAETMQWLEGIRTRLAALSDRVDTMTEEEAEAALPVVRELYQHMETVKQHLLADSPATGGFLTGESMPNCRRVYVESAQHQRQYLLMDYPGDREAAKRVGIRMFQEEHGTKEPIIGVQVVADQIDAIEHYAPTLNLEPQHV